MGKKENLNWSKAETVFTQSDLKQAIKEEYGTIVIKGDIAEKVLKNIDRNPKLRKLSNASVIAGIFLWPLLLVGIAGHILSADDFKNYKIVQCMENGNEIKLERRIQK